MQATKGAMGFDQIDQLTEAHFADFVRVANDLAREAEEARKKER